MNIEVLIICMLQTRIRLVAKVLIKAINSNVKRAIDDNPQNTMLKLIIYHIQLLAKSLNTISEFLKTTMSYLLFVIRSVLQTPCSMYLK